MTRQYINVGDLEVAVKHAKAAVINDGDLGLLLNLLRCGDCPSGAAEPAADLLEGKITKPKHRPRKRAPGAPDEEKVRIALHVIGLNRLALYVRTLSLTLQSSSNVVSAKSERR